MNVELKQTFARIKPVCDIVMMCPTADSIAQFIGRVAELKREAVQELQQYLLFPFITHIKSTEIEKKYELQWRIIDAIKAVLEKVTVISFEMCIKIETGLLSLVFDNSKPGMIAEVPEELKHSVMKCLTVLMLNIDDGVRKKMLRTQVPLIAQAVFVSVHIAKLDRFRPLRLAAIECVTAHTASHSRLTTAECHIKDVPLEALVVDMLASILPGVLAALQDVATCTHNPGHALVVAAIDATHRILCLTMNDKYLIKHTTLTAEDFAKMVIDKRKPNKEVSNKEKNPKEISKRSAEWFAMAGEKLSLITKSLASLVTHEHVKVRRELAVYCARLLAECPQSMQPSVPIAVDILISLSKDEYPEVAGYCAATLHAYFARADSHQLMDSLCENFFTTLTSFPRILNNIDSGRKLSALKLVHGYIEVLCSPARPRALSAALSSEQRWQALVTALLEAAAVQTRRPATGNFALSGTSPWLKLRHLDDAAAKRLWECAALLGGSECGALLLDRLPPDAPESAALANAVASGQCHTKRLWECAALLEGSECGALLLDRLPPDAPESAALANAVASGQCHTKRLWECAALLEGSECGALLLDRLPPDAPESAALANAVASGQCHTKRLWECAALLEGSECGALLLDRLPPDAPESAALANAVASGQCHTKRLWECAALLGGSECGALLLDRLPPDAPESAALANAVASGQCHTKRLWECAALLEGSECGALLLDRLPPDAPESAALANAVASGQCHTKRLWECAALLEGSECGALLLDRLPPDAPESAALANAVASGQCHTKRLWECAALLGGSECGALLLDRLPPDAPESAALANAVASGPNAPPELAKRLISAYTEESVWYLPLEVDEGDAPLTADDTRDVTVYDPRAWTKDSVPGLFEGATETRYIGVSYLTPGTSRRRGAGSCATPRDTQRNMALCCILTEGVGLMARRLKADFQPYLLKTLCLILERVGSLYEMLHLAGVKAIGDIAEACAAGSVPDLIRDNADYLTDQISVRLKKAWNTQSALRILSVVMENSDASILDWLYGIVDDVLMQSLDKYHDKNLEAYLQVFFTFIVRIRKWFPENTQTEARENKNEDPKKEIDILKDLMEYVGHTEEVEKLMKNEDTEENKKSAEEMYKEDQSNQEEGILDYNDKVTEETPPPPRHITVTETVLKRCVHFLSSASSEEAILALQVLTEGLPVLRPHEDTLLPLVHLAWAPLVARVAGAPSAELRRVLDLLVTMAAAAKDFIRQRAVTDILPHIYEHLHKSARASYLKDVGSAYRSSASFRLQLTALAALPSLAADLALDGDRLEEACTCVDHYLSKNQPKPLQELAVKFFRAMLEYDYGAIWYHLRKLADNECVLHPPQAKSIDLVPIIGTPYAPANKDYENNLKLVFEGHDRRG